MYQLVISLDDLGDPHGRFLLSSLSDVPFQSFIVFVKSQQEETGNAPARYMSMKTTQNVQPHLHMPAAFCSPKGLVHGI